MAVSLPSDLIADVMRSADPAKLKMAVAKLESLQQPDRMLHDFGTLVDGTAATQREPQLASPRRQDTVTETAMPYVEFERMVLRNLFESLLPQPESGIFGSGPSAGVWRSLAADQLAGVYADAGGIGIATALGTPEGGSERSGQWPYFSSPKIEAFSG